jgi:hypothetical protein
MGAKYFYYDYMVCYRNFLKDWKFDGPSDVWRFVCADFKKAKRKPLPSVSQFWGPFYGTGKLSDEVESHLYERCKWRVPTESRFPATRPDGSLLTPGDIKVEGQRELKFKYQD